MSYSSDSTYFLLFLTVVWLAIPAVRPSFQDTCLEVLSRQAEPCHPSNNATFCSIDTQCSQVGVRHTAVRNSCSLLLLPTVQQRQEEIRLELEERPSTLEIWCLGGLAVGLISLSGISGGLLWPLLHSEFHKHMMTVLIGLAVGSLVSTAVFQLIPEGFQLKNCDPDQSYMNTAVYAWFSVWLLFSIEAITKIIFWEKEKKCFNAENGLNGATEPLKQYELNTLIDASHQHQHTHGSSLTKKKGAVSNVAWMIIFGDGLHNFIDGMSIGAGFSQSIATGFSISLAIACEEFPHELGDFAILIQSGLPLSRALLYNFLSACTAFVGLALGILLGELKDAHCIFAFAGGLFLYVSLTHLIPELQQMLDESLKRGRIYGTLTFFLENLGILSGSTILYFITKYNDSIRISWSE